MNNKYCQHCQKETENKFFISQKLGLKPERVLCAITCEICNTVKYTGILVKCIYDKNKMKKFQEKIDNPVGVLKLEE